MLSIESSNKNVRIPKADMVRDVILVNEKLKKYQIFYDQNFYQSQNGKISITELIDGLKPQVPELHNSVFFLFNQNNFYLIGADPLKRLYIEKRQLEQMQVVLIVYRVKAKKQERLSNQNTAIPDFNTITKYIDTLQSSGLRELLNQKSILQIKQEDLSQNQEVFPSGLVYQQQLFGQAGQNSFSAHEYQRNYNNSQPEAYQSLQNNFQQDIQKNFSQQQQFQIQSYYQGSKQDFGHQFQDCRKKSDLKIKEELEGTQNTLKLFQDLPMITQPQDQRQTLRQNLEYSRSTLRHPLEYSRSTLGQPQDYPGSPQDYSRPTLRQPQDYSRSQFRQLQENSKTSFTQPQDNGMCTMGQTQGYTKKEELEQEQEQYYQQESLQIYMNQESDLEGGSDDEYEDEPQKRKNSFLLAQGKVTQSQIQMACGQAAGDSEIEKRVKERSIAYVVQKVQDWRRFYETGIECPQNGFTKLSLDDSAKKVRLSRKTLDDYYAQIRRGIQLGFEFDSNKNAKMGVLRKFVKEKRKEMGKLKDDFNFDVQNIYSNLSAQESNKIELENNHTPNKINKNKENTPQNSPQQSKAQPQEIKNSNNQKLNLALEYLSQIQVKQEENDNNQIKQQKNQLPIYTVAPNPSTNNFFPLNSQKIEIKQEQDDFFSNKNFQDDLKMEIEDSFQQEFNQINNDDVGIFLNLNSPKNSKQNIYEL